jgi:hypothetical protein
MATITHLGTCEHFVAPISLPNRTRADHPDTLITRHKIVDWVGQGGDVAEVPRITERPYVAQLRPGDGDGRGSPRTGRRALIRRRPMCGQPSLESLQRGFPGMFNRVVNGNSRAVPRASLNSAATLGCIAYLVDSPSWPSHQ